MKVFHGTTRKRAARICTDGFMPKKPSKRVWFAASKHYATGRAKCQARRTRDRPIVLLCELNLDLFRERYGKRRVMSKSGIIAIEGNVPIEVIRTSPIVPDLPSTPDAVVRWVNHLLGLKPYEGASPSEPGVVRIATWVTNRICDQQCRRISPEELVYVARQFLPERFNGYSMDKERLIAWRSNVVEVRALEPVKDESKDQREDAAYILLNHADSEKRAEGLRRLGKIRDPDLFDWCSLFFEDQSQAVVLAALRSASAADSGHPEPLAPFADSDDKNIRSAALAALAKFDPGNAAAWIALALRDPEPCVRQGILPRLRDLNPRVHRGLYELALHDPNPNIARQASELTRGQGFTSEWKPAPLALA